MKKAIILAALLSFVAGCAVTTFEPAEYSDYGELSGESVNWGFVKKAGEPPDVLKHDAEMLEAYDGWYLGDTEQPVLYLTFDEGYENGYTAKILDVLQAQQVPAAFFVTGPYLEDQGELIKRMIAEGHTVGNHTINHINMSVSDKDTIESELNGLSERCMELYGYKMTYVRPPEGSFSERSLAVTRDLGYKTILWSFAYKDWDINTQQGAEYAFEQVTPYLHNGAILLLHAVSSDNAGALDDIINYAKEKGFRFASLDELE